MAGVSPCARCGFELSDAATKCLFCGHVVGAALPEPTPPGEGAPAVPAAPAGGSRIPRPTIPYRRPDDLDLDVASAPPSSPLNRPGFDADAGTPAPAPTPSAPPAPSTDQRPSTDPSPALTGAYAAPDVAPAPAARRTSMAITLVIAALVGAIAGGLGFLIFIALRG